MNNLLMNNNKIVIIGAGPAGMNAATTLAEKRISSIVIDEHSAIGGVVTRGPLRAFKEANHLGEKVNKSIQDVRSQYQKYREFIDLKLNTQVLGPVNGTEGLGLLEDNSFYALEYDYLLVATGCHEKTIAFPGWMLPGVMTIGGMQLQIKSGLVKPGRKVVLTGTGPLLPVAAAQLHLAGVNVVGVFEAGRRMSLAWKGLSLLKNVPLLREGLAYHRILKKSGIPFFYGWGLVKANGADELEEVVVAPYDENWKPNLSKQKTLKVDSLGVSYGFSSRSQVTQTLGLDHSHDEFSGFCAVHDDLGRTSKDNIYVAGDVSGVYGAQVASEQGKLAAISILQDINIIDKDESIKLSIRIAERMKSYKKFRQSFYAFSRPGSDFLDLPNDETIICRCENVSKKNIDDALNQGVTDIVTLKMMTRIGMGDCQGKVCTGYCSDYMRKKLDLDYVGELRPRFPLAPLPFSALINKNVTVNKKDVA